MRIPSKGLCLGVPYEKLESRHVGITLLRHLRFVWFTNHIMVSIHFFYVICSFTYRTLEADIVLLDIWPLVWGPSRAVGSGVVTLTRYLGGLYLYVRWKVLDTAIDVVPGVIVYTWGVVGHTECCVVSIGVTVILGLHNPPHSRIGTLAPPLSGGTIAPCVDFFDVLWVD
jgi:hypothetical protein